MGSSYMLWQVKENSFNKNKEIKKEWILLFVSKIHSFYMALYSRPNTETICYLKLTFVFYFST